MIDSRIPIRQIKDSSTFGAPLSAHQDLHSYLERELSGVANLLKLCRGDPSTDQAPAPTISYSSSSSSSIATIPSDTSVQAEHILMYSGQEHDSSTSSRRDSSTDCDSLVSWNKETLSCKSTQSLTAGS